MIMLGAIFLCIHKPILQMLLNITVLIYLQQ